MAIRHRVEPRDVPPEKAARRLGLTLSRFDALLPRLNTRGFPLPDPDTGLYDLRAIDAWADRRHPDLLLTDGPRARHAGSVVNQRLAVMQGGKD